MSRMELALNSTTCETRKKNTSELTREKNADPEATRGNSRTVNQRESGAAVASSFDSQWAAKSRELKELENARKEELNKRMLDASLKLEREMNRAKVEHEIMMKKQNIEQQQAELHQLELMYGDDAEPLDRVSESMYDDYGVTHGGPCDFPFFMKNFKVNIETKEDNDADRLNYLIQYCKRPARQVIEHCIIMPPCKGNLEEELWSESYSDPSILGQSNRWYAYQGQRIRKVGTTSEANITPLTFWVR